MLTGLIPTLSLSTPSLHPVVGWADVSLSPRLSFTFTADTEH